MSNRDDRRVQARETLRALECGYYQHSDGYRVDIGDSLNRAVAGTLWLSEFELDQRLADYTAGRQRRFQTSMVVTAESTLQAARRVVEEDGHDDPLVLNFASAKNPGGGFQGGAQAQEESLARSSGLYACLEGQPMYSRNRARSSCLYLHDMIYSPRVPVFRDDVGVFLPAPYEVSFLTAPAANAGALKEGEHQHLESVMRARMQRLLAVAATQGHTVLVLGAWGCGVFRNDPAQVAAWFHEQLHDDLFDGVFEHVVFAILARSAKDQSLTAFRQVFGAD